MADHRRKPELDAALGELPGGIGEAIRFVREAPLREGQTRELCDLIETFIYAPTRLSEGGLLRRVQEIKASLPTPPNPEPSP